MLDRCNYVSKISSTLIDKFLVYYAAEKDKVDREFETRMLRFKDIVREMPSGWKGLIKAQYIAQRIFKAGGLVRKYLNSVAVKARDAEEQEYLRAMAAYPWKFCFSRAIANPAPDFYEMEDVFTGDVFQFHSPSVSRTLSEFPAVLWFTLIGFNGSCYQTYGPVIPFRGFSADDIYFFATEQNPAIQSDIDLMTDLNENPVPYMMLACGSEYPLVFQQENEVLQVIGEGNSPELDMQALREDFKIEYAGSVFKLSHKVWSEPPHFGEVYYEEASGELLLSALTDRGYQELSAILNTYGIEAPQEPDIRLHLPMMHVIEKIFKRKLQLNPYAGLFDTPASPESEAAMSRLNRFMDLVLPYINSGRQPDVAALSKEAGIDPETGHDLFAKAIGRINELRK